MSSYRAKFSGVYFDPYHDSEDDTSSPDSLAAKLRRRLPFGKPKGCLHLSKAGREIDVHLANTPLEDIPALWQKSFADFWRVLQPEALTRYRELIVRALAKGEEGVDLAEKAWLCGVLPANQFPPALPAAKVQAEAAWKEAVAVAGAAEEAKAKEAAEREAREQAQMAELGIRFVSKVESRHSEFEYFGGMMPGVIEETFTFHTNDGGVFLFVDAVGFGSNEPRISLVQQEGGPELVCEPDEEKHLFYLVSDPQSETKQRCYLTPALAFAYHWVRSHDWASSNTWTTW